MRHSSLAILPALGALALSACVTPYETCTRDWFEAQSRDIQRDFQRRNRVPLRRLTTLRDDVRAMEGGIDVFTVLAVASAKRDLEQLVGDFRARVVPEARGIAARCELDQGFDLIVDAFLTQQGVDAELVRTLGLMELFDDPVLRTTLEPTGAASAPPSPDTPPRAEPGGVRARSGL